MTSAHSPAQQRSTRPRDQAPALCGADAVLRALESHGVTTVFGMPGGAILPIYDAMARGTTLRHILVRHEQGAGHMAQGFARATGKPGVVFATSGPGATNLVTPMADARMDSTPLVCITGQVPTGVIGTDAFQECNITGVAAPLVKRSWLVRDAADLPEIIAEALHLSTSGRPGPVLVDIPRDVQAALLPEPAGNHKEARHVELPQLDREAVAKVCESLRDAVRPVLYVGGGVINGDAAGNLRALAEKAQIPVVTTLMAKGAFPEDHQLFAGLPGMHGNVWANRAIHHTDLLLAVGARFDDRVTGRLDSFAPDAMVVHFDIDPREIGKLRRVDVSVVGPLDRALAQIHDELTAHALPSGTTAKWLDQIDCWRRDHPLRYGQTRGALKPQRVLEVLQEITGGSRDVIWTTGVGQHQMWAMQYLRCRRPRTFITSGGHGTMGFGVPAAIGAKAASPESTVICVDGDGSFQMNMQEVATSVVERLPIVVVILNNGYLGMVQQWQTMYFEQRHSHVDLSQELPDYAGLARALGASGARVTTEDELVAVLADALASPRTTVIDARVERTEQCYPMIPPGAAAVDMVEWPGEPSG
jgi:acetolactate synthase-1/2/3 large subunit